MQGLRKGRYQGLCVLGRGRWQGQEIVKKPAQGRENMWMAQCFLCLTSNHHYFLMACILK